MLSIPGQPGASCDGVSRRELLRVGGAGLLGISLSSLLAAESTARAATAAATAAGGPVSATPIAGNFGRAKNFIFVFLQGGPSHIDIWDPKPDAPENIRVNSNRSPRPSKGNTSPR